MVEISLHIKAHTNVRVGIEKENLNGDYYMVLDYGKLKLKLMQLKKINDSHYLVVTDEPIKVGDIVLETYVDGTLGLEQIDTLNDIHPLLHKKVTHSTDYGSPTYYIDFSYIKNLVGEVDVDKITSEHFKNYWVKDDGTEMKGHEISAEMMANMLCETAAFSSGYNQCLEDNKDRDKTTEILNHLCDKMELISQEMIDKDQFQLGRYRTFKYMFDYIKSLTQPKDTWEVEFDLNNNLKLK